MRVVEKITAATFLSLGIATGASAAALDCDLPNRDRTTDPALAAALRGAERDPGLNADVRASVRRMAAGGMPKAEIVDRMVEAYCPLVASDPAKTDGEKREAMRDFASAATDLIYAPADAPEAIILSLPLPAAMVAEVRAAAAKAGVTRSEWMRQAVMDRLSGR